MVVELAEVISSRSYPGGFQECWPGLGTEETRGGGAEY